MPITLAAVGIGMSVAGGVASAVSARDAARDAAQRQADYYNYLAKQTDETISKYEKFLPIQLEAIKRTAGTNISRVQESAAETTKQLLKQGRSIVGAQKVAAAASGVTGATLEDISTSTANAIKEDESNIRYSADLKSWDLMTEANQRESELTINTLMKKLDLQNQAENYRKASAYSVQAGQSALVGGLLSTAGTFANSIYSFGKEGGFGKTAVGRLFS